ncbi:NADP-dependent succinic semialdehyde dehydrogenase [Edaphobacter acidisoli]|uniref:NADP-dependent succinic semialdehyde dehydrogenase n=1 Tax=Edaphobacter acidisoli TaxID=2040573 RepID=A0A916RNT3_9BACT|nr:NAD-dependent succinate-semialdehyde dehydrogenase [Edaphobacter acidisoli]GGA63140.1 NADP-dependent succinic semialdehyde dehydrogenase [Edaphobacter acidisoli]
MPIATINPANNRLIRVFDPLTEEATRQKISLADETFRANAHISIDHRALWMRKLAAILDDEADELAATITLEMGKPIHAARLEVQKCALTCRYYADNAARILAPEHIPTSEAHTSYVRYEPLGIILAIMPWNFPFWQVFRFLAPALMAGNVGLLKHASNVPECALTIESLVRRAGFPRGTFQTLLLGARHVEHVLADPRVGAVTLTGSEPAGRAVAAQAGWLIKKSVLELGGSDPFIVLPSADLDHAVQTAVRARCVNTGQSCIAAKRFLIHDSIYDAFTTRFVELMNQLRVGDPMREDTDLGPLATLQILEELEAQIEAATQSGARILTGGQRMAGAGNYFEPTVITSVPRTSPVYREEIFGPVAMLFRVRDLDEAIAIANDTPFGLAASAWTSDPTEQQRLIAEIQAGAVFINEMVASDPRLPFGGIKHSGYGRELAAAGMREFLNAKTIVIASAHSSVVSG